MKTYFVKAKNAIEAEVLAIRKFNSNAERNTATALQHSTTKGNVYKCVLVGDDVEVFPWEG